MQDSTSLHIDSIAPDSLAADTIAPVAEGETMQGLILIDPLSDYRQESESDGISHNDSAGMSWIYLGLAVLFCIIGIRLKGSVRYLRALVADLTDTRVRHNVFDDTVKETSLIILLNIMWVACAGIMLWIGIRQKFESLSVTDSIGLSLSQPAGIAICTGMSALYLLVIFSAYWIVGNVFSDMRQTTLWIKGAAASTGLQAFLLFPLALVALNYPGWCHALFILAICVFIVGKLVFIYQGFRIFFAQISSWLLFLYYLCSLEIIPVILTYAATVEVCTSA